LFSLLFALQHIKPEGLDSIPLNVWVRKERVGDDFPEFMSLFC